MSDKPELSIELTDEDIDDLEREIQEGIGAYRLALASTLAVMKQANQHLNDGLFNTASFCLHEQITTLELFFKERGEKI